MDTKIVVFHMYTYPDSTKLFLYDMKKKYSDRITQLFVVINTNTIDSSARYMLLHHCTTSHLLQSMLKKVMDKEGKKSYYCIHFN